MAISDADRENIVALTVATFNAAPGATFLQEFATAIDGGMSFEQLADILVATPQFQNEILKGAVTNGQIAGVLLNNFGLTAGNTDPSSPDAQAEEFFIARLDQGASISDVIIEAGVYLLGSPAPEFQDVADLFTNKILVAGVYSETNSDDNVDDLQFVLQGVTADGPSTREEALVFLENKGLGPNVGETFVLTVNQDNLTGTGDNDTFDAPGAQDGAGNLINTLQSVDSLDGGAGIDTLSATLNEGKAVAPTLKNIENVTVRFANAGGDNLNLANATGVNTVTVAESTTPGTVSGLGAVENLAVKNQVQNVAFDGSTAETLNLNLDTVGNFTTPTATIINTAVAAAATTLNVTTNNSNAVTSFAPAVQTLSIDATGKNALSLVDSGATVTSATVTGSGGVDLTGTLFTGAFTTFDASANTGGVKAAIAGTKAVTVTGGEGADVFDLDTGNLAGSSAALGAGDDQLFVGNLLAQFDKGADGGDGTDIINITDGATLDATNSKFITNFETLDVSGGTGNYDVSLNNFATVQIDEAINGVPTGALAFINAPDAFTLNIASKASDGDFALGAATTVTGKDYTGTDESFTLAATLHDGNKDNVANGNIFTNTIVVNDVESLVVDANVGTLDGGSQALGAANHTLNAAFSGNVAQTLTITGDASVNLTGSAIFAVNKVDATASTGNVTINFAGQANSVAYNGAEGVDTYTASAKGDVINTGLDADVVDLTASFGAARDTFVLKAAADSQITDTSGDGIITLAADTGFDQVTSFEVGGGATDDRLDVTNFGFSGAQGGVVDATAKVNATTDLTSIADLFDSPAGDRGIAYSVVGGDSFVFVDANKDGNFTAADDMIVKLTGVVTLSETDINFG